MARTGSQWRQLSNKYGKRDSLFRRHRRWVGNGMFDAMLETVAEMVGRDRTADMIDRATGNTGAEGKKKLAEEQPGS